MKKHLGTSIILLAGTAPLELLFVGEEAAVVGVVDVGRTEVLVLILELVVEVVEAPLAVLLVVELEIVVDVKLVVLLVELEIAVDARPVVGLEMIVDVRPVLLVAEVELVVVANVKPETVCVTSVTLFAMHVDTNSTEEKAASKLKMFPKRQLTIDNTLSLVNDHLARVDCHNAVDATGHIGFDFSRA